MVPEQESNERVGGQDTTQNPRVFKRSRRSGRGRRGRGGRRPSAPPPVTPPSETPGAGPVEQPQPASFQENAPAPEPSPTPPQRSEAAHRSEVESSSAS